MQTQAAKGVCEKETTQRGKVEGRRLIKSEGEPKSRHHLKSDQRRPLLAEQLITPPANQKHKKAKHDCCREKKHNMNEDEVCLQRNIFIPTKELPHP